MWHCSFSRKKQRWFLFALSCRFAQLWWGDDAMWRRFPELWFALLSSRGQLCLSWSSHMVITYDQSSALEMIWCRFLPFSDISIDFLHLQSNFWSSWSWSWLSWSSWSWSWSFWSSWSYWVRKWLSQRGFIVNTKKVDCRKETNWRRKFLCADDRRGRVSSSLLRARYDTKWPQHRQ